MHVLALLEASDALVIAALVTAAGSGVASYIQTRKNRTAVNELKVENTAEHDRNGARLAEKLDEVQSNVLTGFTGIHTRMNGIEARQAITAQQVDRLVKERA